MNTKNIDTMQDWGEIKLLKIEAGGDFWDLIDELSDGKSDFFHNRGMLVEAFRDGNLYGLRVSETGAMFRNGVRRNIEFVRSNTGYTLYMLPCLCVRHMDKAIIIWTHSRARRQGFARKLVTLLDIKHADSPLPESLNFWKACGIETASIDVLRSSDD